MAWSDTSVGEQKAGAGGFSAAASPPRFELAAKPDQVLRDVLTIYNFGPAPEQYQIRSSDWSLTDDNQVAFSDSLTDSSCREWLRLERHKITVMPQQPRKFRWEVHIPEDAPIRECTFAIFIEGLGDGVMTEVSEGVMLPVKGRIAVIVYLAVGDIHPALEVLGYSLASTGDQTVPTIKIRNSGRSHGRLDGTLTGVDASGAEFDLSASTLPILAGQTRQLVLNPTLPGQKDSTSAKITYPITVDGTIFWEEGKFEHNALRIE